MFFLFAQCTINQVQSITETQVAEFLYYIVHIFIGRLSTNNMRTSPHMANMIPMYYIPTNAQQEGLGTTECLVASQEHSNLPRRPPPGIMLPVQQPTFIPQQGKKNILLVNH